MFTQVFATPCRAVAHPVYEEQRAQSRATNVVPLISKKARLGPKNQGTLLGGSMNRGPQNGP